MAFGPRRLSFGPVDKWFLVFLLFWGVGVGVGVLSSLWGWGGGAGCTAPFAPCESEFFFVRGNIGSPVMLVNRRSTAFVC